MYKHAAIAFTAIFPYLYRMKKTETNNLTVRDADPEVNERVTRIIEQLTTNKGYRQEHIARALRINPSGLTRIKLGRQHATVKILTGLTAKYGVNPNYLLRGEGEPFGVDRSAS